MSNTKDRVEEPLPQRIQQSFAQLAFAADELNAVSNELGSVIVKIERVLQGLNVGVPAWVSFQGGDVESTWWSDDLGYAKIHNNWGLAIRSGSGDYASLEHDQTRQWAFNESPRLLRVAATRVLPNLLDELTKQARETTEIVRGKIEAAREFADTLQRVSRPKLSSTKKN